jgi:magnesium transporter
LAASLLDWHLAAYLTALDEIESFADRLDVRMLSARSVRDDLLQELVGARRYLSSLRRSLSPQSAVFYGLSRPDIALIPDADAVVAFQHLEHRYERALDAIEHGRELVQSSFDLFTTRTAETTNNLIRRLTFLSIMLGALGGVAGVFGMNFDTPYAKAGVYGFWGVVAGFLLFGAVAATVARWRKWI